MIYLQCDYCGQQIFDLNDAWLLWYATDRGVGVAGERHWDFAHVVHKDKCINMFPMPNSSHFQRYCLPIDEELDTLALLQHHLPQTEYCALKFKFGLGL